MRSVKEFDERFDEGESVFELATVKSISRPNLEPQRVNVDFPKHFLQRLDREAALRGISRQALIKTWLYERLEFDTFSAVSYYGSFKVPAPVVTTTIIPEDESKSPRESAPKRRTN